MAARKLRAVLVGWLLAICTSAVPHTRAQDVEDPGLGLVHTIIPTSCGAYQDWQVLALYWSWKAVGQPGAITRIACCSMSSLEGRTINWVVPTYFTSENVNPTGKDNYFPYNKPWGVSRWLADVKPKEEFILMLDPDMAFNRRMLPAEFGIRPGMGAAQEIFYMVDLNKVYAQALIPEVASRNDSLADPGPGRLADEVGLVYFYHRSDFEKMAPLWWDLSLKVRGLCEAQPELRSKATQDVPAWVAEMHALSMAAAVHKVQHVGLKTAVYHPPNPPLNGAPYILHYCWHSQLSDVPYDTWHWSKHNYRGFDALRCPPWRHESQAFNTTDHALMPLPPLGVKNLTSTGPTKLNDLLGLQTMATVNMALCQLQHRPHCPPSPQLEEQCSRVETMWREIGQALKDVSGELGGDLACYDAAGPACEADIKSGKRDCSQKDTAEKCALACGICQHGAISLRTILTHPQRGAFSAERPFVRPARRKKPIEHERT